MRVLPHLLSNVLSSINGLRRLGLNLKGWLRDEAAFFDFGVQLVATKIM